MKLRILYSRAEAVRMLRKIPPRQRKTIRQLAGVFMESLEQSKRVERASR